MTYVLFQERWTNEVNPDLSDFDDIWCKWLLGSVKPLIQMAALYDQNF